MSMSHEPANKTDQETVDSVKAHINSIPRYKSHYSRKDNPHREFLNPYLSIQKMYQLYKEKCEENTQAVSEWKYCKIFNQNFNLSFGRYVLLIAHMHAHVHVVSYQQLCVLAQPAHTCTHIHTHSLTLSIIYSPKSDTCKVCDSMKIKVDAESDESHKRDLTLSGRYTKSRPRVHTSS